MKLTDYKRILIITIILISGKLSAQEIITLDLQAELDNGTYTLFEEKEYWDQTYNTEENILSFNDGMFNFSHIPGLFGGTDVGGGMSYWDGFTLCKSGDTTDYGTVGNSDGWVPQQWGCMAGGGLNADFKAEKGCPYLVAYWGYYYETEGLHACQVDFDGELHRVVGTYICNHPWPYYGNIHGDGFASPFTYPGCYFTITAHGMVGGEDTGSEVTMTLAEYTDDETGLVQSPDWQWMDLSALGAVDAVYFTMDTSDADPIYGANTAVYFCLDKMQIYEASNNSEDEKTAPNRPSGLSLVEANETELTVSWDAVEGADKYAMYLDEEFVEYTTDNSYTFKELSPYQDYKLKVIAINDYGESDPVSITAKTTDVTSPTVPENIVAEVVNPFTVRVSWDASEDNVAVTRYRIYVNGKEESRPKITSYTLTGLDPDTEYTIEIDATDASGNTSEKAAIQVKTPTDPNVGIATLNYAKSSVIYDFSGQRVASPKTGNIYIVNGKKQIILNKK